MPDTIEKHQARLDSFDFDRGTAILGGPHGNKTAFYGRSGDITTLLPELRERPDVYDEQASAKELFSCAYSNSLLNVMSNLTANAVITSNFDWPTVQRKANLDLPNLISCQSHSRLVASLHNAQASVNVLSEVNQIYLKNFINAFAAVAAGLFVSKNEYGAFHLPGPETSADLLARVRAHLSLNTTELARTLLTERASIYNWMKGNNTPRPENRRRLIMLASIARSWTQLCHEPLQDLRHALVEGNSTLIDLLSAPDLEEARIKRALTQLAGRRNAEGQTVKAEKSIREIAEERGWERVDPTIRKQSIRGLSLGRGGSG